MQGRVRCWQHQPAAELLLLSMRDNRWCANVGRQHKSNGIYYTGMHTVVVCRKPTQTRRRPLAPEHDPTLRRYETTGALYARWSGDCPSHLRPTHLRWELCT